MIALSGLAKKMQIILKDEYFEGCGALSANTLSRTPLLS